MANRLEQLRRRQVEESLRPWMAVSGSHPPTRGWVHSMRQALGMSTSQLARRLGLSRQGVHDLERREIEGGVTLTRLRKAADAMHADLVYAIVPRTSVTDIVREQAHRVASREMERVGHTMRLEEQSVSRAEHDRQVQEHQERLLGSRSRELWDEED